MSASTAYLDILLIIISDKSGQNVLIKQNIMIVIFKEMVLPNFCGNPLLNIACKAKSKYNKAVNDFLIKYSQKYTGFMK